MHRFESFENRLKELKDTMHREMESFQKWRENHPIEVAMQNELSAKSICDDECQTEFDIPDASKYSNRIQGYI